MATAIFGVGAIFSLALAAFASATSQARATQAAMDALWRQPEAANDIRGALTLALAFMEALTLFVFAIVFVIQGKF